VSVEQIEQRRIGAHRDGWTGQPATPVFAVAAVSVTRAHVGFNAPSRQSNARTGRYGLALS
jgi:hypothetical protein